MRDASELSSNQDEHAVFPNKEIENANPIEASWGNSIYVIEVVVQHLDFLSSVDHNFSESNYWNPRSFYVRSSHYDYICHGLRI